MTFTAELQRFQLHEKLGEGADSEVFGATDTETGLPVVIKRPHPMLIMRAQHGAVEQRMAKAIDLRERLGDKLPHVAKMLAYGRLAAHGDFFGDNMAEAYSVVVEERARGVPLVGSAIDGIKRHPIGAPQNLFAVHPVIAHRERGRFSIVREVLEVAEVINSAGALILDMRPQNIYFDPATAAITVIDIGGVTEERSASGRQPPLDLHDFYLELFKWYMPLSQPPAHADGYCQPMGMETIPMFNQNLDALIRRNSEVGDEPSRSVAVGVLNKVRARAYPDIQAFRQDFEAYLMLLEDEYALLSECDGRRQAWAEALHMLTGDYWRKFRFDPGGLAAYGDSSVTDESSAVTQD